MPDSALITGGTSGIGAATARLLHARGWEVAVTGRDPGAASVDLPPGIVRIAADSRSTADAARVADEVAERFGRLSLLFLNAGISRRAPVAEVDEALFDELFTVNTRGAFFQLQKALPLLDDGGSVVFTVGVGVARGQSGGSVTAGSRGALLAMIPSLAAELAPRRIRVNAVSPGAIDTPIWGAAGDTRTEAVKEAVTASIPFGRLGEADDIAATVAFLASDGTAYLTGQNITVAGGL